MNSELIRFSKEGFPEIRIYQNYFEIKALEFSGFSVCFFEEVKAIDYYHHNELWWTNLVAFMYPFSWLWKMTKPRIFKIIKTNGVDWKYNTPYKFDEEFAEFLKELIKNCGLSCV